MDRSRTASGSGQTEPSGRCAAETLCPQAEALMIADSSGHSVLQHHPHAPKDGGIRGGTDQTPHLTRRRGGSGGAE